LILGSQQNDGTGFLLNEKDFAIDKTLEALYDTNKQGGLGPSSPNVARWLGDIRTFFSQYRCAGNAAGCIKAAESYANVV